MIATIRTTTGRENVVMESLIARINSQKVPIKSVCHPEDLRGYIFIEGESEDIETSIKGIPHIRGFINKNVEMDQIERFLVPAKSEIKLEIGDIVEIIGSPFKGEMGKISRIDEQKGELTVEFVEAAIPIPVTISVNSARLHEKKKQ